MFAQKSSQMFLPFQRCIFADAHATRRFAATGPVAAATRKTIRGPVLATCGVEALLRFLRCYRVSSPRATPCVTCVTLVRRHFYYSAGRRRFDAPRRLCKHDVAFAAFFYICTQEKKKTEREEAYVNNLRMRRAGSKFSVGFPKEWYRNARSQSRNAFFIQQI